MPLPISQLPTLRSPFSGAQAHPRRYLTRTGRLVANEGSAEQTPTSDLAVEYCARNEGSFVVSFSDIERYNPDIGNTVAEISAAVGVLIDQTVRRIRRPRE